LLALAIAAFFTIISGIIASGIKTGWMQGVSIYFAIILIVSITSLNDWAKDKLFVRLQSELKNQDIAVIRGKYGATQSVNVFELVVGDIVLLETGSKIPADCILIEGQDITVDETKYFEDETKPKKKLAATEQNIL
jgi:P-type E1-E2 ATPase